MLFDFAELNNISRGGLYIALYEKIKQATECGAVTKGEKLPSVREAARLLGVSRTTIENAYTRLCIEGLVESVPQRGYFITGNKSLEQRRTETETQSAAGFPQTAGKKLRGNRTDFAEEAKDYA
jgi:DNA-binding transcriptional regulator YhcF (GntR family)